MFDADEFIEAMEPPVFRYRGRTYKGRILSDQEMLRFAPRLQKVVEGKLSYLDGQVLVYQLGKAIFPKPWWQFWRRSVGSILLKLPTKAREAALQDFLAPQGKALGVGSAPDPTPGSS